jgi:hypothetical protein
MCRSKPKICTVAMLHLSTYTLLHNLHSHTQFTAMLQICQTSRMYWPVCYLWLSNCKLNQLLALSCRCVMVHKAIPLTVTYNSKTSSSCIIEANLDPTLQRLALFLFAINCRRLKCTSLGVLNLHNFLTNFVKLGQVILSLRARGGGTERLVTK